MPEYVRVKDKQTKHEYSVVASAVNEDAHQVLKRPATNPDGTPLPPKHHVSLSNQSGQKAESQKESN